MALAALSGDEQRIIFSQLCNVLDPGVAVGFSAVSSGLWASTQALRQQLSSDHEVAAALCRKLGMQSCKELREAKEVNKYFNKYLVNKYFSADDLELLGTLGSVLPALETLILDKCSGTDGVQRLAAGLGAGALPTVYFISLSIFVGDAGASALAAALDRGALPQLEILVLSYAAIGDAGLVALVPALRRRPALEKLWLVGNPLGDEGIAALVAPPPPAGALSPPAGVLAKLRLLNLRGTRITDTSCTALVAALDSGALPALDEIILDSSRVSGAGRAAVKEALNKSIKNRLMLPCRVSNS